MCPYSDSIFRSRGPGSDLLAAARLAGTGGTVVVCANDNPPEVVIDLLVKRDIRRHSKRVWGLAKELQLSPFVRMVECRFNRRTAPSAPSLGCKVLGPKKVAEDEWELRLLLPADSLGTLKLNDAHLRSRYASRSGPSSLPSVWSDPTLASGPKIC